MTTQPEILLTDPAHFDVSYSINPWMDPSDWTAHAEDYRQAAQRSWKRLETTLKETGARVHVLEGRSGLPDMVFPANAGVVLDGIALLARFKCPERQGEEPYFRTFFERLQNDGRLKRVESFPDGIAQEGAGDCLWDKTRQHFWGGYGQRSDEAALPHIEKTFGQTVVGLELIDPRYYHLDVCFYPLEGGEVVYFPGAFSPASLDKIRSIVPEDKRIEANEAEAQLLCLNAVRLDRKIICAKATPRLKGLLAERNYSVTELDLDPFILSGGAAFCMTLRLDQKSGS